MNLTSHFVAGIAVKTKGLLPCLCFLLAACFTIPAWGEEHAMRVEEFAKKLEEAGDWSREKLEAMLGVKFTDNNPGDGRVGGRFVYGKGLIVSQILHGRSQGTHETLSLYVLLSGESSCFRWDRLKKMYPGANEEFGSADWLLYIYKTSWGEMEFGFEPESETKGEKYCLKSIETRTNKYLDILKEHYQSFKKQAE